MDDTKEIIFHPVDENKNAVAEHVTIHYRKYLFLVWALCWGLLFWVLSYFRSTLGVPNLFGASAAFDTTLVFQAVEAFDQIDTIAHQRDVFFHQTGMAYSNPQLLDSSFTKMDTIYHLLDRGYHTNLTVEEKFVLAQKFDKIIDIQDELFHSVRETTSPLDANFHVLDTTFHTLEQQIQTQMNAQQASNPLGTPSSNTFF